MSTSGLLRARAATLSIKQHPHLPLEQQPSFARGGVFLRSSSGAFFIFYLFVFFFFFFGRAVSRSRVLHISIRELNVWWANGSGDWMLARRWCEICGERNPEPYELSCEVHLALQKSNINGARLCVLSQTHEWIIMAHPAAHSHQFISCLHLEGLQWFHDIYSEHRPYVCQEDHSDGVMQMYINSHVNMWFLKITWTCISFHATPCFYFFKQWVISILWCYPDVCIAGVSYRKALWKISKC